MCFANYFNTTEKTLRFFVFSPVSPFSKLNTNFVSLQFSRDELFLLDGREEDGHEREVDKGELKEDVEEAEESDFPKLLC